MGEVLGPTTNLLLVVGELLSEIAVNAILLRPFLERALPLPGRMDRVKRAMDRELEAVREEMVGRGIYDSGIRLAEREIDRLEEDACGACASPAQKDASHEGDQRND